MFDGLASYISVTKTLFLLDKGHVAENLQKKVFLLFLNYIFYYHMEEPFQPYISVLVWQICYYSYH